CTLFLFSRHADPRVLPSFPTRRSSDLSSALATAASSAVSPRVSTPIVTETLSGVTFTVAVPDVETTEWTACPISCSQTSAPVSRSEEHTSELQSRENLVCRLLLEKKKQ